VRFSLVVCHAGEGGETAEASFLLCVVDVVSIGEDALLDGVISEEGYDVGVEAGSEHAGSELGVGLYVVGGGCIGVGGVVAVVVVFVGGWDAEATGTSAFVLVQTFLFAEC